MHRDPGISQLHRATTTYVVIDGMPLVLLCRLAGIRATRQHRVTNLDLIWPLFSLAEKMAWRVYYLGSSEEVIARGIRTIRTRLPRLKIRVHHGFVGIDCADVIADITRFRADLLMVGMGMGLQERWIYRNMAGIAPTIVMPVGALMEYVAGTVRTPPRWMGRFGVEWLFRLVENPRRFWRRYLIEPWLVAWTVAGRMAQSRASSSDGHATGVVQIRGSRRLSGIPRAVDRDAV
jgi:N-acetylglucosaminyldiphosphoundecaprenol N-acetyl-beta-D-mannosaminyltransferase